MKFIQMVRILFFRMFNPLAKSKESDHFIFYYSHQEQSIDDLTNILESNFTRISAHFPYNPKRKIKVYIYKDLDSFHYYACGLRSLPKWVVGMADSGGIRLVTPKHDGAVHNEDDFHKIIVHELTHVIIHNHNKHIPNWLHEGIAVYEADQMTSSAIEYIAKSVHKEEIPRIEQLECDSVTFGERNGYDWSCTIIHFIVHKYGYDHLLELCKNPHNFEKVFGYSKPEFEKRWIDSLKEWLHGRKLKLLSSGNR